MPHFFLCLSQAKSVHLFLNQTNITNHLNSIQNEDNINSRDIKSFRFKRFIESSSDITHDQDYAETIQILGNAINNSDLLAILNTELNENSEDFLRKKLLQLEISRQRNINPQLDNLSELVGILSVNNISLTGTLIFVPDGDSITAYVLTSAHLVDGISRNGSPNSLEFTTSMGILLKINTVKVFKRSGKNVLITYLGEQDQNHTQPPNNTMYFLNSNEGAIVCYDGEGDVALCQLDTDGSALAIALGINTANIQADFNSGILSFEDQNNRIYSFHFINDNFMFGIKKAQKLVSDANSQPNNNHVLGYPTYANLTLYQVTKRSDATKLGSNFIGNFTMYSFNYDAPNYWGMSGGPIFQIDQNNNVQVYGVVKGLSGRDGDSNWGSKSTGAFLQMCLFS